MMSSSLEIIASKSQLDILCTWTTCIDSWPEWSKRLWLGVEAKLLPTG